MTDGRRIAVVVAALAGMVSTFLPWISSPLVSVDGSRGDGWFSFGFSVVALLTACNGWKTPLSGAARLAIATMGVLDAVLGLWKIVEVHDATRGHQLGGLVTIGGGLYLLVASGATLVIVALLGSAKTPAPTTGIVVPACPTCLAPTIFVHEHRRHYCRGCRLYV